MIVRRTPLARRARRRDSRPARRRRRARASASPRRRACRRHRSRFCVHGKPSRIREARRRARAAAMPAAMRPGSASALASRAASATVRVNVPSWSSVSLKTMRAGERNRIPRRLESDDAAIRGRADHRAVGLRAERARRPGRRRPRPPSRTTSRRAYAAAFHGFLVLPGCEERERRGDRLAEHVAAGALQPRDAFGVVERPLTRVDRRAHLGRQVRRCR